MCCLPCCALYPPRGKEQVTNDCSRQRDTQKRTNLTTSSRSECSSCQQRYSHNNEQVTFFFHLSRGELAWWVGLLGKCVLARKDLEVDNHFCHSQEGCKKFATYFSSSTSHQIKNSNLQFGSAVLHLYGEWHFAHIGNRVLLSCGRKTIRDPAKFYTDKKYYTAGVLVNNTTIYGSFLPSCHIFAKTIVSFSKGLFAETIHPW